MWANCRNHSSYETVINIHKADGAINQADVRGRQKQQAVELSGACVAAIRIPRLHPTVTRWGPRSPQRRQHDLVAIF